MVLKEKKKLTLVWNGKYPNDVVVELNQGIADMMVGLPVKNREGKVVGEVISSTYYSGSKDIECELEVNEDESKT